MEAGACDDGLLFLACPENHNVGSRVDVGHGCEWVAASYGVLREEEGWRDDMQCGLQVWRRMVFGMWRYGVRCCGIQFDWLKESGNGRYPM